MNRAEQMNYENTHNEYGGIKYGVTSKNYKETLFEDTLQIVSYSRGRSAAQFTLRSATSDIEYNMFLTDTLDLIVDNVLEEGKIKGMWGWKKRGCNFGIYLVEAL
jgi:hypothetical protein